MKFPGTTRKGWKDERKKWRIQCYIYCKPRIKVMHREKGRERNTKRDRERERERGRERKREKE